MSRNTNASNFRNTEDINSWFGNSGWHMNWIVKPDSSINKTTLFKFYSKNPEKWKMAFSFLKNNDLSKLELKRYDLDGENLFVLISEYSTKNPEDAKFEAHRKYIDIQYVVSGSELIGIAPITSKDTIIQDYDQEKDLEFFTTTEKKMVNACNSEFFIFFPEDAHMPCVKDKRNEIVRKVVVKVKVD